MKRPPIGIDETPSSTRGGAGAPPGALLDDLELAAQRNLALARLNSSPLPPIQTNPMGGGAGVGGVNGVGPAGPGPNPTEQSLYSHLYGKEMGLMRKLTAATTNAGIDDYPNHVARNYQQLLQQQQQQQHPDPTSGQQQHHQQQQMQQNFAGHPHAAAAAKFNQFNYPNPGGLLKPCYDYTSQQQQQQQHPMPGSTNTGGGPNQQMKKEIFNLSGTNGVDLYPPPSTTSTPSSSTTPSSNGGGGFMNLHQPSAAAAAAAAAMYASHFNNGAGPNGKLEANGDGGLGGLDFMRNNATANGGKPNNLIKSAAESAAVLMARSSIMNNLNNNLNKIEPNTDTTLNDSNNNHPHQQQQQQGHNHGLGGFGGGNGGGSGGGGGADDEIDKLSSPMTGTSTLTNTDLNDPEQDGGDADDGYTIL